MALLASCWLLVESFVIPDGLFLKFFYLSFYIHPIFLIFSQIFLWLNKLQTYFLLLISFPFKIPCFLSSFIFKLLNRVSIKLKTYFLFLISFPFKITCFLSSFIFKFLNKASIFSPPFDHSIETEVFYDAINEKITQEYYEIVVFHINETNSSCFQTLSEEVHNNRINEDSWLNEYLYSDHYDRVLRTYYDDFDSINSNSDDLELQDSDTESKSTCGRSHEEINCLTASLSQLKLPASSRTYEEFAGDSLEDSEISSSDSVDNLVEYLPAFCSSISDPFHQKYTERMRFFEVLYHERVYGLDAILNEHITSPQSFNSLASSTDFSMQYVSWNKMARKSLMKSLECDFELIYVAQLCLSWEALHHEYQKVEALTLSDNSEKLMFHHSVSGKFQEFQVLLERLVEEGQRYSRHKRLSFQGSLRVPDISSFVVEEGYSMGGEAIKATQVLEAIEKCIEAFWSYLKIGNKKSLWKYKGILRIRAPVEDPRDLELLYNVTEALHKKGKLLKELQGKKKCWLRAKVEPVQEQHEKTNQLFAMIELKLVQKLLKMSVISSSHLKWCQEKLNNIEFRHGKVFRGPMNHLFPSS